MAKKRSAFRKAKTTDPMVDEKTKAILSRLSSIHKELVAHPRVKRVPYGPRKCLILAPQVCAISAGGVPGLKQRKLDTGIYTKTEYSREDEFEGDIARAHYPVDGGFEFILKEAIEEIELTLSSEDDRQIRDEAEVAANRVNCLHEELTASDRDIRTVVEHAYHLGKWIERLKVRCFERPHGKETQEEE